jgi:hypothetical protein
MIRSVIDEEIVTVVSGLPRSGTSMMMQMLRAGGIPVLVDGLREADEDNLGGYFEFEPVKKTKADATWLEQAPGKAVKMVYLLLYDLPKDHRYRVVFMRRQLEEVLHSQKVMLQRHGQGPGSIDDQAMMALFQKDLSRTRMWLDEQENFDVLYVDYGRMVTDPKACVGPVNEFLGGLLDVDAMVDVVDPSQHRVRR